MKIVDKIKANWTSTMAQCSNCAKLLDALINKGVIKNRHDARFWGLPEKKILCGNCLRPKKRRNAFPQALFMNWISKTGLLKKRG